MSDSASSAVATSGLAILNSLRRPCAETVTSPPWDNLVRCSLALDGETPAMRARSPAVAEVPSIRRLIIAAR